MKRADNIFDPKMHPETYARNPTTLADMTSAVGGATDTLALDEDLEIPDNAEYIEINPNPVVEKNYDGEIRAALKNGVLNGQPIVVENKKSFAQRMLQNHWRGILGSIGLAAAVVASVDYVDKSRRSYDPASAEYAEPAPSIAPPSYNPDPAKLRDDLFKLPLAKAAGTDIGNYALPAHPTTPQKNDTATSGQTSPDSYANASRNNSDGNSGLTNTSTSTTANATPVTPAPAKADTTLDDVVQVASLTPSGAKFVWNQEKDAKWYGITGYELSLHGNEFGVRGKTGLTDADLKFRVAIEGGPVFYADPNTDASFTVSDKVKESLNIGNQVHVMLVSPEQDGSMFVYASDHRTVKLSDEKLRQTVPSNDVIAEDLSDKEYASPSVSYEAPVEPNAVLGDYTGTTELSDATTLFPGISANEKTDMTDDRSLLEQLVNAKQPAQVYVEVPYVRAGHDGQRTELVALPEQYVKFAQSHYVNAKDAALDKELKQRYDQFLDEVIEDYRLKPAHLIAKQSPWAVLQTTDDVYEALAQARLQGKKLMGPGEKSLRFNKRIAEESGDILLIRDCLETGYSYKETAKLFEDYTGMSVSNSTLYNLRKDWELMGEIPIREAGSYYDN